MAVASNNGRITLNMTLSEAMTGLCNNDGVAICLVRRGFMTGHKEGFLHDSIMRDQRYIL